jgi:hypothetical protein
MGSYYVEVWGRGGRELRALDSERLTVGTLESNDVVVDADGVSRVHAVLERFGDTWCVRDLGSRNGTFVNGGRIIGERTLHSGDEILLGRLRLLFRGPAGGTETAADRRGAAAHRARARCAPALLPPALERAMRFTEPASIRAIAAELVVSEAAVKQHLSRLYDKFDVGRARRTRDVSSSQTRRSPAVRSSSATSVALSDSVLGLLRDRYRPVEVAGRGGEGRVLRADRSPARSSGCSQDPSRPCRGGSGRTASGGPASSCLSSRTSGLPLVSRRLLPRRRVRHRYGPGSRGWTSKRLLREEGTPGLAPSTVLRHLAQAAEALTYLHAHDPDRRPRRRQAPPIRSSPSAAEIVLRGLRDRFDGRPRCPGRDRRVRCARGRGRRMAHAVIGRLLACNDALHAPHGEPTSRRSSDWPSGLDGERRRVFERGRSGSAPQRSLRGAPPRPVSRSSAFVPAGKPRCRPAS